MRKHLVAVTWECCGYIEVEAATLEEAMGRIAKNPDDYSLPHEAFYVDGSFRLSTDDVDEMKAICTF